MEWAIDPYDGTTYTAEELVDLDIDEREVLHGRLVCPSCDATAWWRRPSRDGKAACFFATDHADDCDRASPLRKTVADPDVAHHVEAVAEAGVALRIDGARLPSNPDKPSQPSSNTAPRPSATTKAAKNRKTTQSNRVLQALLTTLIHDPDFAKSDSPIETDAGYTWRARHLLVPFEMAEAADKPHLYWGRIVSTDRALKWLNTGPPPDSASIDVICFYRDVAGALGVSDPEHELTGAYCIESQKTGKPIIRVHKRSPKFIAVRPT